MRRFLLSVLVLLALPTPAAAAQAQRCPSGAPPARIVDRDRADTLVICDRRGRGRVARRIGDEGALTDVAHRNGRIAWAEERYGDERLLGRVVLADARGRVRRRFAVVDAPLRTGERNTSVEVELLAGGLVAWRAGLRVVVVSPRGRPRRVGTAAGDGLAVEDGRTLRWPGPSGSRYRFADPVPLPVDATGCPRRRAFKRGPVTAEHVVSTAAYPGDGDEPVHVTRVCLRETGDDPAVGLDESSFGFGPQRFVSALAGRWALVTALYSDRYRDCASGEVRVVDLRTGSIARRAGSREPDCRDLPFAEDPAVVTRRGAPAWIARRFDGERLRTLGAGGALEALDTGPFGSITELTAEGEAFGWRRDGEVRSAPVR